MYIKISTQEYPITEQEIRQRFPQTSFPLPFIPPENYAWVYPYPKPSHNSVTERLIELVPELTANGTWEQRWDIVDIYDNQEDKDAALAQEVLKNRASIQTQNKTACEIHILAKYPLTIQITAQSIVTYGQEFYDTLVDFRARCIMEENRVFDLLEDSNDPKSVEKPVWPEV